MYASPSSLEVKFRLMDGCGIAVVALAELFTAALTIVAAFTRRVADVPSVAESEAEEAAAVAAPATVAGEAVGLSDKGSWEGMVVDGLMMKQRQWMGVIVEAVMP